MQTAVAYVREKTKYVIQIYQIHRKNKLALCLYTERTSLLLLSLHRKSKVATMFLHRKNKFATVDGANENQHKESHQRETIHNTFVFFIQNW